MIVPLYVRLQCFLCEQLKNILKKTNSPQPTIQSHPAACNMLLLLLLQKKSLWDVVSNMHHETKKLSFDAQSAAIRLVEK